MSSRRCVVSPVARSSTRARSASRGHPNASNVSWALRTLPAGVNADDLVVHQQDVQAAVNALWAGGAEAMSIMGVRVISTSAVRCVGNTLLLGGRVYSPPFVVTAIGDPGRLGDALGRSPAVRAFEEASADFGLVYQVKPEGDVTLPAYDGSTSLQYAEATD